MPKWNLRTALTLTTMLPVPVPVLAQEAPPVATDAPATAVPPVTAPGTIPADTPPPTPTKEGDDGTLTVTGTRLPTYDPSSDIKIYTAVDIGAMGVSNVQDFLRLLPQNQASVGYGLNNRNNTPVRFDDGGLGGLGVAGVNLRGLGNQNTLILVNGRRIAGAAGIEEGFANVNNIPLAAVERVEISLGGDSAIYGADALGGVVNFILKRGYKGVSATARREFSGTGADTGQFTLTAANSWGSGSVTGTLSYSRIRPALNARLGYTTHDYRTLIDPQVFARAGRSVLNADQRSPRDGAQPAAVYLQYFRPSANPDEGDDFFDGYFQSRAGISSTTATRADLEPFDIDRVRSRIAADAGENQANLGVSINIEQRITDRLSVTLDYLGARNRQHLREMADETISITGIPLDQAYNPFSRSDLPDDVTSFSVDAFYHPWREYADGRVPRGFQRATNRSHTLTGGLVYKLDPDTAFRANYTWSRSTASGRQRGLLNVVSFDVFTGQCGSDGSDQVNALEIDNLPAAVAAQCDAIFSSDPARAFNFLGDGSPGTPGAPASVFFLDQRVLSNVSIQSYGDMLVTAAPFTLPAGKVRAAFGVEYRSNSVDGERIRAQTLQPARNTIFAAFAELRVPVFDEDMDIPGFAALDLTGNLRYDRYGFSGPIGTRDNIPLVEGGEPVIGDVTIDNFSPRVGVSWKPVSNLTLRGSWSSNFSPPAFTALYDVNNGRTFDTFLNIDPLAPNGQFSQLRNIIGVTRSNPLLRPERSTTLYAGGAWTPAGALAGLSVETNFYRTIIRDQIGFSTDLERLLPAADYFGVPDYFVRDAAGQIQRQNFLPVNIGRLTTDTLDVKVDWSIFTSIGTLTPSIYYIRNLRQVSQPNGSTTRFDQIGLLNGLDRYRLIGYLDYQAANFSARLTGRYTPSYGNDYGIVYELGQPSDADFDGQIDRPFPVASQTTFDLTASWRYNNHITVNAGGRNILKADPPFALVDRRPFDASRYDIRGRVLYLEAVFNL